MNVVEARALLVQADLFPGVWPRLPEVPSPEAVGVHGGQAGAAWQFEDLLDAADSADPAIAVDNGDPHIIRFSAGTTGRLKGILHTVDGWIRMAQEFMLALPRTACEDVFLVAGPLSHAASLLLWPTIGSGAALVVMPRFRDPYHAYEPHDRDVAERLLSDDFTFTSPQDDHIDRALVSYQAIRTDGTSFDDVEHLEFRDSRITHNDVCFGAVDGSPVGAERLTITHLPAFGITIGS
jgi:acyl-CoA synthetase (AMP-forming)/AMP-acid ligase II